MSIQQACKTMKLLRSRFYYREHLHDDSPVEQELLGHAADDVSAGFWKMQKLIRKKKLGWNHKRVHRVYCKLKLNIRRRAKRRLPARVKQPLQQAGAENQTWSIDFMSDVLQDNRKLRTFNVLDDYNRQCLGIEIDTSLPALRITRVLQQLIDKRGKPQCIRCDNGPEFISKTFVEWCNQRSIQISYIQPGKPMQNSYIERFNGSYRRAVLDAYIFHTLDQVRQLTEEWIHRYNHVRPHDSLGDLSPIEFTNQNAA